MSKTIITVRFNIVEYLTRDNVGNAVLLYFLAVVYSIAVILALHLLKKNWKSQISYDGTKTQRLYLILLAIQCILRSVFFWLLGGYFYFPWIKQIPDAVWFVLLSIGCDLFFSTFIIVVYFWAKIYHFSRGGESISAILIVILNGVLYFDQLCEFFLFFFDETIGQQKVETFSNLFDACYALSLSLGLGVYAWRLLFLFGSPTSVTLQRGARLLASIAGICTLCFTLRAAVLVADSFATVYPSVFVSLYFFVSELLPEGLLLYLFRKPPRPLTGGTPLLHKSTAESYVDF